MRVRAAHSLLVVLGLVVGLMIATTTGKAAAAPKLTAASVTPMTGTTATLFQFSVQFQPGTETASIVNVSVAGTSLSLARNGGPEANQIWTGSMTLPAGSWTATFSGTTASGTNPAAVSVTPIVVTIPTPRPTSIPATPGPAGSVAPSVSPAPLGTTVTDPSSSSSGSEPASSSNAASRSPPPGAVPAGSRPFNVPIEGVAAIGLLGAVTLAAALGERRRRQAVEAFRAAQADEATPPPGEGREQEWEPDIADDETVATIDYDPPDDPLNPRDG